ncbi:MAG: hypothetical protein IJW46_02870, partial [Clostridia bacterium]|nr:hypothetical protein [Clostridia bacterium]
MKNILITLILMSVLTVLLWSAVGCSCAEDTPHETTTAVTTPAETTPAVTTPAVTTPETSEEGFAYRISTDKQPTSLPYPYVNGGSFSGNVQAYSPDPLVAYRWENADPTSGIQLFAAYPIAYTTTAPESFSGLDSVLTDEVDITVKGVGQIMFDFGVEFAGWLEIDIPNLTSLDGITFSCSEYTQPQFLNRDYKTGTPVRVDKDTYRLALNAELYEGIRFGFITVSDLKQEFHITGVRLICEVTPANYEGSYDSDNGMLNKIWYAAAYGLRANFRPEYLSAILVDRGDRYSWTGDAYPAQASALAAFANYDYILKNLRYTETNPAGWNIESYELYWILSVLDYYEYSGDKAGVQSLLSHVIERLDHAYAIYDHLPNLVFFGWDERLGAGFESPNTAQNQLSYRLLAIQCFKEAAPLFQDLGKENLAKKYARYAEEKTAQLLADPEWYKDCGMHAFCDAVNAGVVSDALAEELFSLYFNDRANRYSFSPFNEYFVLQALAKLGKHEDAVSSILDVYGSQITYGITMLAENFDPEWANILPTNAPIPSSTAGFTSLSHPWSAGVLVFMNEELLGIKATLPGFAAFSVTPHLSSLVKQLSGETPTPYGKIRVAFDLEKGEHFVTVPEGTVATVAIPKAGMTVTAITLNGKTVSCDREDGDFLYFDALGNGTYHFTVSYEGDIPEYQTPDYQYTATFKGYDRETKGNWIEKYGSEGYLLCGNNAVGAKMLPDYIANVILSNNGYASHISLPENDERLLHSNSFGIGARSQTEYKSNYESHYPFISLDIYLTEERPYTVALYFLDWENAGRSLIVDLFDRETLDRVAPVQLLEDHTGGVYMIFEYDRSAHFRIHRVTGKYIGLAGVFFGESAAQPTESSLAAVDNTDDGITYRGLGWAHEPMANTYLSTFSHTRVAGAYAEYTFVGDQITFYTSTEANRGIAEIFIDGKSCGKVDLYHPNILRQLAVFKKDLPYGEHTIRVVVTGEKNPHASDCYVEIDCFEVRGKFVNETEKKYDDRDPIFSRSGDTVTPWIIPGAYQDTLTYSNVAGDYIEATFNGTNFTLLM